MAESSISDFFKQKSAKSVQPPRDWTARKKAFVADVEKLYKTIEKKYLKDAGAAVTVEYADTTVREITVGEYPARQMIVRVGDEQVTFTPKGLKIFGASGRVDVQGERGDGMLILQQDDRWGVVQGTHPTLRVIPLDSGTLLGVLRDVMRP